MKLGQMLLSLAPALRVLGNFSTKTYVLEALGNAIDRFCGPMTDVSYLAGFRSGRRLSREYGWFRSKSYRPRKLMGCHRSLFT
jgi:hypothetical protein